MKTKLKDLSLGFILGKACLDLEGKITQRPSKNSRKSSLFSLSLSISSSSSSSFSGSISLSLPPKTCVVLSSCQDFCLPPCVWDYLLPSGNQ